MPTTLEERQSRTSAPGMPQMQPMGAPTSGGMPPTGLQQQLSSLNNAYAGFKSAKMGTTYGGGVYGADTSRIGFDVRGFQVQNAQMSENQGALGQQSMVGQTSLDQLARSLAQNYGLSIGRGRLVDEEGNFLMTPEQLANASQGADTIGTAAAKMNFIAQAISKRQNEQQQQKGIAAIQSGLGQVQQRGRGSLASMQSGYYRDLANLYANKEYESADFSYWIEKEKLDLQAELLRRQKSEAKKQARVGFIAGIAVALASAYSGNIAGVAAGIGQAASSSTSTGWF